MPIIENIVNIQQNFTIVGDKIIKDGIVLTPKEGKNPATLPIERKKRHKPKIPTLKNGTILENHHQFDEKYTTDNHIA